MIQQSEVVMLLVGSCVFIFTIKNRSSLKRLPAHRVILASFYALSASWLLTVLENFFWGDLLNILEHTGYALSSVLLGIWCWQVFRGKKETG